MNLKQAFKMAFKSISSKKMRSFLTMLGIIIGVAAVIILVSVVQGSNKRLKEYYESMGTNQIQVQAYSWNKPVSDILYDYCLSLDDLVVGVTPSVTSYWNTTVRYGTKTLTSDDWETMPRLTLGSDQYSLCNNYQIARGRDLSYLDVKKYSQVCVLGAQVAKNLFNYADPINQEITVNGNPFTVIGVYEAKATDMDVSVDNVILAPYTLNDMLNNGQQIDQYIVKAKDSESTKLAITKLRSFLKGIIDTNYGWSDVYSPNTWQEQNNQQNVMMSMVLGGIAGISLLVGGIGIMNIMLVTVTERTREIGIRKAIGAERKSIIAQFLIEAAVICGMGGILGILIGALGTLIAGKFILQMILLPSTTITIGAFAFSVVLGILFGMYPAIKASGLQPVVALRAE
ncbi:ABC transporter permease [Oscillospiraceae bacterium]|nr:ABC transporter permease [Oscillospiraceae bacterium]BDF73738.1 ABC transporter permease [Oscillospiraceae bacterium]